MVDLYDDDGHNHIDDDIIDYRMVHHLFHSWRVLNGWETFQTEGRWIRTQYMSGTQYRIKCN